MNIPAERGAHLDWRCPILISPAGALEKAGNSLQCSCLESFMDRGAWQATVHEVAESDRTKRLILYFIYMCVCVHMCVNFPQFVVIYTVKVFGIINKAEVDVFLEFCYFFYDPAGVGN